MTTTVQRSPDGATGWADIPGTTDVLSYVEQAADSGYYLRVKETKGGVTVYSATIGPVGGGVGPAPYPSKLRTSGQNIVDENGAVMQMMRGFNIQVVPWSAQTFLDLYAKGARLLRTVIFWDSLEPSQGSISASYIANLDTHIARMQAAGLYTTFAFYFGPNGGHSPAWAGGTSNLSTYTTYGQNATQYLAKRYGAVADPLGAGKYTKAVVGFGLNEPTPDTTSNTYLATMMSQQQTMMTWFRAFAPDWIGVISGAYGNGILYPNAPGSGHSGDQTFTAAAKDPFAGMGNWLIDLHCYFMATTSTASNPAYDGRSSLGIGINSEMIKTNDAAHPAYPPVGTRTQCQSAIGAYWAPAAAYCGPGWANVPLINGEFGWPEPGFTGGDQWAVDVTNATEAVAVAAQEWWDYNTSQGGDPYAARPGSGAPGGDVDGWQTAVNAWLAT